MCWKKKASWSSNQAPPCLTPYTLTTQPMPPLLLTVLHFCFINGFLSLMRPIVDIVKSQIYTNEILEYSRKFYEHSIRSLEKMCVLVEWFQFKHIMQYKKKSLVVSVVYIVIFSFQQIHQQRNTLLNHRHFLPLKEHRKIKLQSRSEIYSKTTIQVVKKGCC